MRLSGLLFCAASAFVPACAPRMPGAPEDKAAGQRVIVLDDVSIDRFEEDRLSARGHARRLTVDRLSGSVAAEKVEAERLEAKSGKTVARLVAPTATTAFGGGLVGFAGGVRLADAEGRVLTTKELDYDARRDWLRSRDRVELGGDNFVVRGTRLVGQPRAGALELLGPLTSTVARSP